MKFTDIREGEQYTLSGDTIAIDSIEWRENVRTSVITFSVVRSTNKRRAPAYSRSWGLANFQNMATPIKT